MTTWVADLGPNAAICLLALGGLLICLEFHRPGTVVYSAMGLFLVLLAAFRLFRMDVHPWFLALFALAFVLIALDVRLQLYGIVAVMGVIALGTALWHLTTPAPAIWVAYGAAAAFGAVAVPLSKMGETARRAKTSLSRGGQ